MLVCEQHDQPINADANSGCRRHALCQRPTIIFVHDHRLFITALALCDLILETLILLFGIVEFREAVRGFKPANKVFEALSDGWIRRRGFGKRRDWLGKVSNERRLNQMWLSELFEELDNTPGPF